MSTPVKTVRAPGKKPLLHTPAPAAVPTPEAVAPPAPRAAVFWADRFTAFFWLGCAALLVLLHFIDFWVALFYRR